MNQIRQQNFHRDRRAPRLHSPTLAFTLTLILLLAACNLPEVSVDTGSAATAAALTVQAALATQAATPTVVSIVTNPGSASLVVTDNVNCRSGPGTNFAKITVIPEGTSVPILARAPDVNWWLVDPADVSESCWVSGELGTASGNTAGVPQATSQAGVSAGLPARPANWSFTYTCPFGDLTTNLSWSDSADNENGYRVFRNGLLLNELPPNSTGYVDQAVVDPGVHLEYTVVAFNDAGTSPARTISFNCE